MADDAPLGGYPGGYWGAGATALGAGADLYAFFDNLKRQAALKRLQDILTNPAKLNAYIQQFYQPLTANAINATNRDIGANWATQTGGAPGGAMNQFTADAFAKLESDRYQNAAANAIRALSGAAGGGLTGGGRPMGNLQGILDILMKLKGAGVMPGQTPKPAAIPTSPANPYPLPVPAGAPPDVGMGEGPFLT